MNLTLTSLAKPRYPSERARSLVIRGHEPISACLSAGEWVIGAGARVTENFAVPVASTSERGRLRYFYRRLSFFGLQNPLCAFRTRYRSSTGLDVKGFICNERYARVTRDPRTRCTIFLADNIPGCRKSACVDQVERTARSTNSQCC